MAEPGRPERSPRERARDVFRAGEKLMRGLKLYGRGHAMVKEFAHDMAVAVEGFASKFGRLEIALTTTEVLLEGEPVLKGDAPERNFAYPLAQAGFTRLRFESGIRSEELIRLLLALTEENAGENDVTVRVWLEDFPHVRFEQLSDLERADPRDEATAAWLRAAQALVKRAQTLELEKVPRRPPSLEEIARDGLAQLTAVPPPPLDKVRAELKAESPDALTMVRAIGYAQQLAPADAKVVHALIEPALLAFAEGGQLEDAVRLIGVLEKEREKVLAPIAARVAELALLALAAGKAKPAAATELLKKLGPNAAGPVVDALGTMEAGPARQAMAQLLLFFGDAGLAVATEKFLGLPEGPAVEVLSMVVRMQSPGAIDLIDIAASHPSPAVAEDARRRAPEPSQMSPGRAASRLLSEELRDRSSALSYLRLRKPPNAAGALAAAVGDARFAELPADEKQELLEALGELDRGAAVEAARRLFAQKSLLGGAAQEAGRLAAAVVLGKLVDRESRAALDEAAKGRGSNEFKQACRSAVAAIDRSRS